MENHFYHMKWPPFYVTILLRACVTCVMGDTPMNVIRLYESENQNSFYIFTDSSVVHIRAAARDFQQFDFLTSVDSDEPLQPPFKLRNSKWCSVSSLTVIEYSSG